MEARQDRIKWIYASRNNKELLDRYDQWAREYDADLDEWFGYIAPRRAVGFFTRYVPQEARILDAGAGTGMVGSLLTRSGYSNLVAVDLSLGMLEEARKKNVYHECHQMVMGEPLGFATDSFDAVICVGVLTLGHAKADSFDELIRVTRPGGHIVFSLRPDLYQGAGFKEKQGALEAVRKWQMVEVSEEFQPTPKGEPDTLYQIWVYQVIS
ncbi:class I SAM-dependent DNA methyltransferase [Chloroflexota bacterium]